MPCFVTTRLPRGRHSSALAAISAVHEAAPTLQRPTMHGLGYRGGAPTSPYRWCGLILTCRATCFGQAGATAGMDGTQASQR